MDGLPMDAEARIPRLETAADVAAAAERVYGSDLRSTGVVHVMAVWHRDEGPLVTLRTGDGAPRCHHDALALGLARARADALITTGEILRREPAMVPVPGGPGTLPAALDAWRCDVLGRTKPPLVLVMTAGGDVDLQHPVFGRTGRTVLYTSPKAAWGLESRTADRGVEMVVDDEPSLRRAIAVLRGQFGAATLVVEAGPSVSRRLYDSPGDEDRELDDLLGDEALGDEALIHESITDPPADELMLTVLHRADLETRFRGPRFLPRRDIEAVLGRPRSTIRVRANGDDWEIARYTRLP